MRRALSVSPVLKDESYFALDASKVANLAEVPSSSDGGVAPKQELAGKIGLELSGHVPRR
jgi:hypothetical protein